MTTTVHPIEQFRFDSEVEEWVPYRVEHSFHSLLATSHLRMKLAQLNVLFDAKHGTIYKPNICFAEDRYEHIFQLLFHSKDDALDQDFDVDDDVHSDDVVGAPAPLLCACNEVTTTFIERLMSDPYLRRHGFVISNATGFGDYFGNIFVSSVPFARLYNLDLSESTVLRRPPVLGVFSDDTGRDVLAVVNMHTTAYSHNGAVRRAELEEIYRVFRDHETYPEFENVENVLLIGDLNFHSEDENCNIGEGFSDVWRLCNGDREGFTFDGERNWMLREMWPLGWLGGYFDAATVQMRLDRWLWRRCARGSTIRFQNMRLFANELVYREEENGDEDEEAEEEGEEEDDQQQLLRRERPSSNFFKDLFEVASDYFWSKSLFRRKEEFLFPSDHFGLRAEIEILQEEEDEEEEGEKENGNRETEQQ